MSADQIARIRPYMQFDRAIYQQAGLGLGLVIVQDLLALYGGRLAVESKPQPGTQIHLYLKCV